MVRLICSRRHYSGSLMCLRVEILNGADHEHKPRKRFKGHRASASAKHAHCQVLGVEKVPNPISTNRPA